MADMTAPLSFGSFAARVKSQGLRKTAIRAIYRLDDEVRLRRWGIWSALQLTMVNISKEELGFSNADCVQHNPTESYHAFRTIMKKFVHPTDQDTFLDYGSGLGRVLLMAGTFPFQRIIGVEYSTELNTSAAKIIGQVRRRLKCQNIELITADAASYEVPPDVTVIYFFNPFGGDVLENVVQNIKDSLLRSPRTLRIIYYLPDKFEQVTSDCDWLIKKGEAVFPAVSIYRFAVYQSHS